MPNLRDIKRRISSVQSTRQITRTMEMVATAKIKKAQERIESARPYALSMMEVLGNVARYVQGATHPLLEEHPEQKRIAIISLTSDRGLCGAFNANILRLTEELMRKAASEGAEADVIAVGKKALSYLKYRGVQPVAEYRDISDKPTYAHARDIAARIIAAYSEGRIDAAYVVFNRFKNVAEQKAEVHQLLPIERKVVDVDEEPLGPRPEYLFEPSPAAVLEKLLPTYVETLVYRALLESAASEQGARRVAMKSATDNAGEIITTLTRSYNRARQASITNEIAEIVGGAAALEES
ncbi:ATP synthase F1 subunit gamma [Coriobacteriia bacterium Es71-Z0120]|uniref:ATP synthase F1 subunit gamma n=1 Tax=Parvivirga hydrogeniphila TaxID=2939460 RepID=UPI002260AEE0|nr:ATP synthase F1 subunit gamma [Parvivirga hydrogeniphila]MCL4078777.1 ATP synthase F1 subunit gamma [Parvivirga hydrogeniphila]